MSRPALSASRSTDVLNFLATFPERAFTLSEIMRATKINVASCHAVLSTLVDSGYLSRCANQRTYTLGRALVALGQAALRGQPLITRAQEGAEELQRELGTAVLLTTVVGEEILAVLSLPDASGRAPGMRAGERMPLVAPIGAPFVAWSSAADIKAWISRHTGPRSKEAAAVWQQAVLLTRKRGYQVTLRAPNSPEIATLIAEMASGGRVPDYKDEVLRLVNSFGRELSQPETLVPDELYDLLLISAPLFERNGEAAFNLSLFGFSKKVSGSMIVSYADRLVRSCLDIMRADREQPARRDRQAATPT